MALFSITDINANEKCSIPWLLSFHSQFNAVNKRYFTCNALFGAQFNKNVNLYLVV